MVHTRNQWRTTMANTSVSIESQVVLKEAAATVRDAQNLMYRYFTGSGDVAAAVEEVEGTVPALEGSIEPLGLPSVGSGLLPSD